MTQLYSSATVCLAAVVVVVVVLACDKAATDKPPGLPSPVADRPDIVPPWTAAGVPAWHDPRCKDSVRIANVIDGWRELVTRAQRPCPAGTTERKKGGRWPKRWCIDASGRRVGPWWTKGESGDFTMTGDGVGPYDVELRFHALERDSPWRLTEFCHGRADGRHVEWNQQRLWTAGVARFGVRDGAFPCLFGDEVWKQGVLVSRGEKAADLLRERKGSCPKGAAPPPDMPFDVPPSSVVVPSLSGPTVEMVVMCVPKMSVSELDLWYQKALAGRKTPRRWQVWDESRHVVRWGARYEFPRLAFAWHPVKGYTELSVTWGQLAVPHPGEPGLPRLW